MAEAEDAGRIKRRSRRRLVGAIALVLAAVIVLPMVLDPEPRTAPPPVSVRIPGEDESAFSPRTAKPGVPQAPAARAPDAPAQAPGGAAGKADRAGAAKPAERAPQEKPAYAPPQEQARAQAALADAAQFYVPVGAYADPGAVLEKLTAAKLPFYTEPLATKKGQVIRVRAGPFGNRADAEKALEQLKALGFKPGSVASRS
jgi:DedD protein